MTTKVHIRTLKFLFSDLHFRDHQLTFSVKMERFNNPRKSAKSSNGPFFLQIQADDFTLAEAISGLKCGLSRSYHRSHLSD